MKKFTKLFLICFALFLCLAAVACGKQDYHTDIRMATEFTHEQGVFKTAVSSSVTQYDLLSKMEVHETATIEISKSNIFEQTVDGSNLELAFGDNIYFAKISNKDCEPQVYKFNIFRNSMLTVSFDTKGGSAVESILVERNTLIEAPKSVKSGYSLRWNYDFTQPVTEDIIINAIWTPNDYKITIASNEADGENVVVDIKYDSEYDLSDKVQPKAGYRLNGFYYVVDDHQIDFAVEGVYKTASNVTLYAKYELVEYSITYILEKGATNSNTAVKFTINDVIELLNAEWKNDEKTFDGWYLSSEYKAEDKVTSIANLSENVTLWAKFVPTIFITNVNCYVGNDVVYTYEFTYNSQYLLETPTIGKGYKFDGWYFGDELIDESNIWNKKDKSIDLKAKLTPINYSIVYKIPNGALNSENIITYNADMGSVALKDPSFGNHIFEGWYLDADYTTLVTELTIDNVSEKMTIYSKWQYVTNVTIDSNDADCDETELVFNYGKEYVLPKVEKKGYVFKGWYYGETEIECVGTWLYKDAEVELVAKFDVRKYSIEYVLPTGAENDVKNVNAYDVEMGVFALKDPSFGNHIFQGWYLDADFKTSISELTVDTVSDEMPLYSKWQYVTNVVLNPNDAECADTELAFYYGKEYALPKVEKKGYIFKGWYYGEIAIDCIGTWSYKDAEIELWAKFEARNNNIEYILPAGAQNNSENLTEYNADMDNFALKDPSFGNHIFEGWYLDADFKTPITQLNADNVTEEMTIYSKWQYVTNVIIDSNGANCEETELVFNYGKEYALPKVDKLGYEFKGWYYGETEIESVGTWAYKDAEITLVAKFEAKKYGVEFILPSGAINNAENANEYNADMGVVELKAPSFGNHIFEGWYLDADYKTAITELNVDNVYEKMTIYSKWLYVSQVTLNLDGGTSDTGSYTFNFGKEYKLPTAEKLGYTFVGWFIGETEIDLTGVWAYKDENVQLVAKYLLDENVIKYSLPEGAINGENINVYTVVLGTVQLINPTFGSHIFEGWYLDSKFENKVTELNVYNVTNGMTLYSKWQYVSNVKFDLNGSNELIEDKVFYFGQEYTLPTPIKAGCLFEGWYVGDNKVTDAVWNYKEDVVLTANWVATTIAINYELNGGVQNPDNPQTFAVYTGIIELKAPTYANGNRLFYGWYTDIEFKNPITHIDTATVREITLYAKWIGTDIKVEYDANSGYVASPEQIISHGSSYSLLIPERPGYQFNGWYYNGQLMPSVGTWTIISESVSLVAQWTKQQYNITYDLGGVELSDVYTTVVGADGTVTKVPVTLTYQYDVDSTVTIPRLFKDGYIFLGWQTNSGSVQEITIVSGSIGNRTYKASWIVDTDANGFKYAVHEDQYLICVDFMTDPGNKTKIDMPSEYGGLPVKAIATNAFSAFGLKHGPALKNKQYYYTIVLPKSITEIQTDAFINCNGICVSLRDDNGNILDFKSEDELKEWEKNVSYAPGKNVLHVRDCIWGFRPAIGWTRFSAVEIPDDYE